MKKILGIIIALALGIPAYASITVSPTKIEINANKVRSNYATTAIEVKGLPDKPIRYRAYTGFFKITEGRDVILLDDKTDKYNISDKVRFVPSEFTIPPGRAQKVRVNITNIKNLPEGESRAVIFLEDVNPKEMNLPNQAGISTQLIVKTRVAVPVYVDKGKFTRIAVVESFGIEKGNDGLYTKIKILSNGNSRVRYSGIIQIIEDKKLIDEYSLSTGMIPKNSSYIHKQKIKTDKITKEGEYTIRLILSYNDENDNRKNIKKETVLKITGEI